MIKKFRTRFIIITMVLVGAVSLAAFFAIGAMNYNDLKAEVNFSLERAVAADPMSRDLPELGGRWRERRGGGDGVRASNIPIYSVTVYSGDSASVVINNSSTAYMDDQTSAEAINAALERGEGSGVLPQFNLYYRVQSTPLGINIAFADTSSVTEGVSGQALMLAGSWIVLMLAMFGISVFLSRYVARPVEKAWKEQQRFIADASHELKTPLAIIMADVAILSDSPDKTVGEQNTWVESISVETERMKRLTEDMLTLAQADAGIDQTQLMSQIDVSSIVEMEVLQFDAVAFERGLDLQSEVEEGLSVLGDTRRIENLVKTLLENACKYARKPGVVKVDLRKQKNQAVLSVHNDGDPIPAEDLAHLFDRFYRSDKARASEDELPSFGLGLSIAKTTVELHGGTIDVASNEGGTTFTVRLPLVK